LNFALTDDNDNREVINWLPAMLLHD